MEAKHTPGPWEVNGDNIFVGNGWGIARVHIDLPKHKDANARLIAASPDLLELLEELLAMCERQRDFNDDGDGMMFDRARATIAKAKGA